MTADELIEALLEIGTPGKLVIEVARIAERLAITEALAEREAANREAVRQRVRRHRDKKAEQYQQTCNVTETLRNVTPPQHILPPLKKVPKKEPSRSARKIELPENFEFNEADRNACDQAKWSADKIASEFERFKDHAAQNARRCADWHAAWRSWVRSPFQIPSPSNNRGMNGHVQKPGLVAACDELLDEIRSGRQAAGSPNDGSQASLFAIPGGRRS